MRVLDRLAARLGYVRPQKTLLERLTEPMDAQPPDLRTLNRTLLAQRNSALQALSDFNNVPLLQDALARVCRDARNAVTELERTIERVQRLEQRVTEEADE